MGKQDSIFKIAAAILLILFLGNLNAIIDLFLHPDIPYFDLEHIIVGGITGFCSFLILLLLNIYFKKTAKANTDLKNLILELENEKERVLERGKKLLQLNLDKDRFISILSHDLKSPFNNLLGITELLKENIRIYDLDKIENFIKSLNKSAWDTYNLLGDILQWARSQQGNIPFDPKDLSFHNISSDTIEILSPVALKKNITITYSGDDQLIVFADNNMLKTVLRNLITNAIKFSKYGGTINITAEKDLENVTISVSDNGVGIRPQDLTKLFDISQVITTKGTANETGTGLGLLICKEFIIKHSGKIWVESEYGKGSIFRFTLPVTAS